MNADPKYGFPFLKNIYFFFLSYISGKILGLAFSELSCLQLIKLISEYCLNWKIYLLTTDLKSERTILTDPKMVELSLHNNLIFSEAHLQYYPVY